MANEGYFKGAVSADSGYFKGALIADSITLSNHSNSSFEDYLGSQIGSASGTLGTKIDASAAAQSSYTNSMTSIISGAAKSYADSIGTTLSGAAKSYADLVGANVSGAAEIYATAKAEAVSAAAKAYANAVVNNASGTLASYLESLSGSTLSAITAIDATNIKLASATKIIQNEDGSYSHVGYLNGEPYTWETRDLGDYLIIDTMVSADGHTTKFMVDKNGLLTADNAWIKGTVIATDGSFKGSVSATNGCFTGDIVARTLKVGSSEVDWDKAVSAIVETAVSEIPVASGLSPDQARAIVSEFINNPTGPLSGYVTSASWATWAQNFAETHPEWTSGAVSAIAQMVVGAEVSNMVSETQNADGSVTHTISVGGRNYSWDTFDADGYMIFGNWAGDSGATSASTTAGFIVSKDGLLTAKNAVVYGKIYASEGYFKGDIEAQNGTFRGSVSATSGYFDGDLYADSITLKNHGRISFEDYIDDAIAASAYTSGSITSMISNYVGSKNFVDEVELSGKGYVTAEGVQQWANENGITDSAKVQTMISVLSGAVVSMVSSASTPEGGVKYTINIGGQTYDWVSYDAGSYMLIGNEISGNSGGMTHKFLVSRDGLLEADNAWIRGTVIATDGYFQGSVSATSGYFHGSVSADSGYFKGDIVANSLKLGSDTGETIEEYVNERSPQMGQDEHLEDGGTRHTMIIGNTPYQWTTYEDASGFITIDNTVGGGNTSFRVSQNGLLQADNAIINGTIYGTQGWFRGSISATNGYFEGVIAQPFAELTPDGASVLTDHDNVVFLESAYTGTSLSLLWDKSQIGRKITLVHNVGGGKQIRKAGTCKLTVPIGTAFYFYEDGIASQYINFSNEVIQLLGYGYGDDFYGYIVLERKKMLPVYRAGHELKLLAVATLTSGGSISDLKTFDGTSYSPDANRAGWHPSDTYYNRISSSQVSAVTVNGKILTEYTIRMPDMWFSGLSNNISKNLRVQVTPRGYTYNIGFISGSTSGFTIQAYGIGPLLPKTLADLYIYNMAYWDALSPDSSLYLSVADFVQLYSNRSNGNPVRSNFEVAPDGVELNFQTSSKNNDLDWPGALSMSTGSTGPTKQLVFIINKYVNRSMSGTVAVTAVYGGESITQEIDVVIRDDGPQVGRNYLTITPYTQWADDVGASYQYIYKVSGGNETGISSIEVVSGDTWLTVDSPIYSSTFSVRTTDYNVGRNQTRTGIIKVTATNGEVRYGEVIQESEYQFETEDFTIGSATTNYTVHVTSERNGNTTQSVYLTSATGSRFASSAYQGNAVFAFNFNCDPNTSTTASTYFTNRFKQAGSGKYLDSHITQLGCAYNYTFPEGVIMHNKVGYWGLGSFDTGTKAGSANTRAIAIVGAGALNDPTARPGGWRAYVSGNISYTVDMATTARAFCAWTYTVSAGTKHNCPYGVYKNGTLDYDNAMQLLIGGQVALTISDPQFKLIRLYQ